MKQSTRKLAIFALAGVALYELAKHTGTLKGGGPEDVADYGALAGRYPPRHAAGPQGGGQSAWTARAGQTAWGPQGGGPASGGHGGGGGGSSGSSSSSGHGVGGPGTSGATAGHMAAAQQHTMQRLGLAQRATHATGGGPRATVGVGPVSLSRGLTSRGVQQFSEPGRAGLGMRQRQF